MSKPRDDWWPSAVRMVRNFPARRQEHDITCTPSFELNLDGMPHGAPSVGRTTEDIAIRQMAPAKVQEFDAVNKAIQITEMLPGGALRVELIRRMYWSGKKVPMKSVVAQLHIAEATGKRWHGAFIRLVGELFGYIV